MSYQIHAEDHPFVIPVGTLVRINNPRGDLQFLKEDCLEAAVDGYDIEAGEPVTTITPLKLNLLREDLLVRAAVCFPWEVEVLDAPAAKAPVH